MKSSMVLDRGLWVLPFSCYGTTEQITQTHCHRTASQYYLPWCCGLTPLRWAVQEWGPSSSCSQMLAEIKDLWCLRWDD